MKNSAIALAAAQRLLADIRELAPDLASRAAEAETARRIPPDLVERLRAIGVFRMFAPRSQGGLELDLATGLEIIGALARIDGALGWTAMIGSGGALFLPLLPRETYEEIYRNGPDVIVAGSAQPVGRAEVAPGGWKVTGRWPFASGCQHADWMVGFCVMTKDGTPLPGPTGEQGPPSMCVVALPAREWQIEDTWHVAGLKGTGSHHISLRDKFVPEANVADLAAGAPCQPGPLYQAVQPLLPLLHGSVVVAMAEGALAELVALANTGRQQSRAVAPMRESEFFQSEIGRVAAEVKAAGAFLHAQTASHWGHALAGTLKSEACLTESTQAATWISTACVRAADTCFALGGGAALYESSPLQRRLRDLHAAAQHAVAQQRNYAGAGKLLLDSTRSESEGTSAPGDDHAAPIRRRRAG